MIKYKDTLTREVFFVSRQSSIVSGEWRIVSRES